MNATFLESLCCPFCRGKLEVSKNYLTKNKRLVYGIVHCPCTEYPILDGVLILAKDRIRIKALDFIKRKNKRLSTISTLPFFLLGFPVGTHAAVLLLSLFSSFNPFQYLTFVQFIRMCVFFRIFNMQWGNYLLYRTKEKIFFPGAISTSLVKNGSSVLDAGCGAGHLLSLLKANTDEGKLCGVDKRLINLYLAKTYYSHQSNYIYCDLEYLLPFSENFFDYIFSNDAFHLIGNQEQLAKEFMRVARIDSFIILNHLHNRNFAREFGNPNEYSDIPLGYVRYFQRCNFSLFSEKKVEDGELEFIREKDIKHYSTKLNTVTLIFSRRNNVRRIKRSIKNVPGLLAIQNL